MTSINFKFIFCLFVFAVHVASQSREALAEPRGSVDVRPLRFNDLQAERSIQKRATEALPPQQTPAHGPSACNDKCNQREEAVCEKVPFMQRKGIYQHVQHDMAHFALPKKISEEREKEHRAMGKQIVAALRRNGIFYIDIDDRAQAVAEAAMRAHKKFVGEPLEKKLRHVSEKSFSGYIASGEEQTAMKPDAAEIFTVCKDLPEGDARVRAGWPCHGAVPWPSDSYREAVGAFMRQLGEYGDVLLQLIALGMDLPKETFLELARDGWHHMRVLHFPERSHTPNCGIGSHTDYGMLVIATQDEVGGLFVRPPIAGEQRPRNWREGETTAGLYDDDNSWFFVPPVKNTLTCFTGDMFQVLTNEYLLSTPHKVVLNTRERFALAYFHEPNFDGVVRPLHNAPGATGPSELTTADDAIHYGTHFTNMFMRCYPDRCTTKHIREQGLLDILAQKRKQALHGKKASRAGRV